MQPQTPTYSDTPIANPTAPEGYVSKRGAEVPSLRVDSVVEHTPCEFGGGIMTDLIFKLTVNQLCGVLRKQGIEHEAEIMLGMLESLVIAGEIALPDFIERVQNLFPDVFARIDRALISKLTEIAAD